MSMPNPNVNYRVADRDFKYYIFDWDDNILHMPTRIRLERREEDGRWAPHAVSTAVFSVIRGDTKTYRPPEGDWEKAFVEFRDIPNAESAFLRDTRNAIRRVMNGEEKPAPSFLRFKRALIEGRLFAIVTARGHKPESIRAGVEHFIAAVLTAAEKAEMLDNLRGYLECFQKGHGLKDDADVLRNYLDTNRYHPVTSPEFKRLMGARRASPEAPEEAKQFAIRDFLEHLLRIGRAIGLHRPISVGFSDDDAANVAAVEDYIRRELAREFPGVKFVVYDTSDPDSPSGRKVVVQGQLNLALDAP